MTLDFASFLLGLGVGIVLMLFFFARAQHQRHLWELGQVQNQLATAEQTAATHQETAAATQQQLTLVQADLAHTHGQIGNLQGELEAAHAQISALQAELEEVRTPAPEPEATEATAEPTPAPEPAPVVTAAEPTATTPATPAAPVDPGLKQDLKVVNGIGNTYEKRLNGAGITNFAQLATHTAEQLKAIIRPQEWQAVDFESWIVEAQILGANPALLTNQIIKIANLNAPQAQQLFAGGVRTVADLAAQTADTLRTLINPHPDKFDPAEWIADAQRMLEGK